MSRVLVIDPASTEFNRGSFCYLPYILYSYIKSKSVNSKVELWEDFTATQIDDIEEDDTVYVALWSYPQVDLCKVIYRFSRSKRVFFFGYTPLAIEFGLPSLSLDGDTILNGIQNYPQFLVNGEMKHILLSDCDMHLKKYEGLVYPMFSSYGCPRDCSFCPSCVACNHKVLKVPFGKIEEMFKVMYEGGVRNIHFTDEDFFLSSKRALKVLQIAKSVGDFNFITLAHLSSIQKFLKVNKPETLKDLGVRLIELGFETADEELAESMNKGNSLEDYIEVHDQLKEHVDIFWLCLTFFPGETITTLNETGEFLSKYGYQPEALYGRLVTNSTEGGLGQFFQPYPGTRGFEDLSSLGTQIEDRPVRLLPSFIPNSFLEDEIEITPLLESRVVEILYWCDVYRLPKSEIKYLIPLLGQTVRSFLVCAKERCNVSAQDAAVFVAILARLRAIRSRRNR